MTHFADRIGTLGTENAFSVGADIAKVAARGVDVVKLNIGEPDFDSASHINEAAIAEIRRGNSHYCDPQGLIGLRQAICDHIERSRGLRVSPDRVVVTTGGKPGIGFTIQAYANPGDEVIYPSPGFPIYESWITFAGATPVPLHLREETGFTFTADDLAALITPKTRVIFLCSPSNPTGGVLSKDDLEGIARVIRERAPADVRIYSDEIYEQCIFDGETHHSIAVEPGMEQRTIIASGHSKGFAMTGWRLGYVVLPTAEEAAVFKQLTINTVSCVPPFIQEAGRIALTSDESAPAMNRMVTAFQERRDWIVPTLNAMDGVRCQNPKGAFYVFPNVAGLCERLGIIDAYHALPAERRAHTSPSAMLQMFLLYGYGVATMDRNSFGKIGASGQHFLRLSIATGIDRLREGVARIQTASSDNAGFDRFMKEEGLYS
ncbi:MAG: aminotransferase class I/II-fold pyridoxal phosphate-dependent enzyme [Gemmatimonadota bacterium]|nr:aminotransferase class I/II-fold pyridoxal phosphate-dependent enzyme [Gemmatimonadota bacterium]